jgi:hypothetical protein
MFRAIPTLNPSTGHGLSHQAIESGGFHAASFIAAASRKHEDWPLSTTKIELHGIPITQGISFVDTA